MIKSQILIDEKQVNIDRHVNADPYYYPVYVVWPSGLERYALLTKEQLFVALARAEDQPEQVQPRYTPWYRRLLNRFVNP